MACGEVGRGYRGRMTLDAIRSRFAPLTPHAATAAPPPPDASVDDATCVSCRRPADTPYCPHCGERRAGDRPLHVRELFEELWGTFVSIDGRVARTFWTLLRHPGALTAAYVRGERRRYLTPLGVFFSVNALFFVFATAHGFTGFTAPLNSHLHDFAHQALAQRLVGARLAQRHTTLAAYATAFDAVAAGQSRTLLLALVPVFAACAAIATVPHRRPALQHVTFALHAVSVVLLASMTAYYGLVYGSRYVVSAVLWIRTWFVSAHHEPRTYELGDGAFTSIIALMFFAWLAPAVRRVYGGGWPATLVRGAALTYSLRLALQAYQALLFFTAYWTT